MRCRAACSRADLRYCGGSATGAGVQEGILHLRRARSPELLQGEQVAQTETIIEKTIPSAQHCGRRLSTRPWDAVRDRETRREIMRAVDRILRFQSKTVTECEVRLDLPVVLRVEADIGLARADRWVLDRGLLELAGIAALIRREVRSVIGGKVCLLYTSPSPRDRQKSRMPSS